MRVGVIATPMRIHGGGARFVFVELMDALLSRDPGREYIIYTMLAGMPVVAPLAQWHPRRCRVVELRHEDELFAHADEFDVLFGPLNNLQPRLYDRPSVAILHDIQEHFFPEYFEPGELAARREIYPEICRSATVLVTISEFCKRTIVDAFDIDPGKVRVMYNAAQRGLSEAKTAAWSRPPPPDDFYFYPANCYRHKNHALLLEALSDWRARGVAQTIVFTGFEVSNGYPLRAEIARRGLAELCRVYDEVSPAELQYLYRRARALVFPTQFEGFGLPLVEAMQCGCPVVCSDLAVLREVAGDAALYFDPASTSSLRAALDSLETEPNLRARLIDAGQNRAGQFSWGRAADCIHEAFESAAREFNRPTSASSEAPRVALGLMLGGDVAATERTLRSVYATGHPQLALRARIDPGAPAALRTLLDDLRVTYEHNTEPFTLRELLQFASECQATLVGVLHSASGELRPSAIRSLLRAAEEQPSAAVLIGEAWETDRDGRVTRVSRLRRLGNGLWKVDGFIFPEMVFLVPAQFAQWGAPPVEGPEWRWPVVKLAHQQGRLGLVRRSLAVCRSSFASLPAWGHAVRSGLLTSHQADGTPAPGRLGRVKVLLRPLASILPGYWRQKGRQVWHRLVNG